MQTWKLIFKWIFHEKTQVPKKHKFLKVVETTTTTNFNVVMLNDEQLLRLRGII